MQKLTFHTGAPVDSLPNYLVAARDRGCLYWYVANCYPDEGLFVSDAGVDIPFSEVVCWATLPEEVDDK